MIQDKYFLENNLFDTHFLGKLNENSEDISDIFTSIKRLYDRDKFVKTKEASLEIEFIHKVFELLGYEFIYRERISFQGQSFEPDNTLFGSSASKDEFIEDNSRLENILLFAETKGYGVELDNTSKDKKINPHYQLLDYLKTFKIDYGFLTNGRKWRFYDNSIVSTTKTFYEIDLEAIIDADDIEAFGYFYFVFRRENFYIEDNNIINKIAQENKSIKLEVENDLKNIIYGTEYRDSIFEIIGKSIYEYDKSKRLQDVYQNTLYLVFRLLFIAYFEDKNRKVLSLHKHYNTMSLNTLYEKIEKRSYEDIEFNLYGDLRQLFRLLSEGNDSYSVPLFNGGLFNIDNAPLLQNGRFINNEMLDIVITSLLVFDKNQESFRRDFKNLSIINLGSIYEGLLEYRFEIAREDLYYVEYLEGKNSSKTISSYMDSYDYGNIKKEYITKENYYKAGDIYLTNSSNSRKSTASYYTPTSLSSFMVKSAIDLEIEKGKKPIELKIIDNSCGSGHFLLESLSYLTQRAIISLPEDKALQEMVKDERVKIEANLLGFNEKIEVSDYDILKRLLLKKSIFGVDLNPFSVELTKLALWIDSLIFGTPLSFLSHHIKQGNSLVGSKIEEFNGYFPKSDGLFHSDFISEFNKLNDVYKALDNIQDTTEDEVNLSKQKYKEEITPKLDKLNLALNLVSFIKFKTIAKDKTQIANIKADTALVEKIFEGRDDEIIDTIREYAQKYSFFNYEVEFPEVTHNNGFDIVIGNPPWDKTKLDDKDFFSQYRSNYRTLSDSKKAEIKSDLLSKEDIKSKYENESQFIYITNEYLKAHYPLNKGTGDGNLFRFFVENNLKLIRDEGSLTYVLPSALFQEDGSVKLRTQILKNYQLNYFYGFENREKLFDIDSRYKFGVFQIENIKPNSNHIIKTKFMQTQPKLCFNGKGLIKYDMKTLKAFSPTHLALADVTDKIVFEILKKAYARFEIINPDYINFRNELHMTSDKDIFYEEESDVPLYEGKMIHQFNSKFAKPTRFLNLQEFDERLKSKEIDRMARDLSSANNSIKFTKKDIIKKGYDKFIKYDREFFRFTIRAIASDTNERTLIGVILPKNVGFGHSMFAEIPKRYAIDNDEVIYIENSSSKKLFLMSIFNSFVVDFIARLNIAMNVSKTYLMRLPIPQPSDIELNENRDYQTLIINSLKLTLHYNFDDFKELAKEYNITKKDLPPTPKQVDMLKIKNDIIIAQMYGISYKELEHILSTFKVFDSKNHKYIISLLSSYAQAIG